MIGGIVIPLVSGGMALAGVVTWVAARSGETHLDE